VVASCLIGSIIFMFSRLFWSDWNREYPKIEFSGLDGQERQILVGEGLALPNSLVVDTLGDQLCWADAGTHKIGREYFYVATNGLNFNGESLLSI